MQLPEVVVYATFSTEQVASRGQVIFTDNQFSVDAADGTIYTPVRMVAHLDQNGYMRVRLPLNAAPDSTPQPRSYHCQIDVESYTQSFDFVLSSLWTQIDLATIIPVGTPPVLSEQYVSSVAGMTGNVSAQALIDALGPMDPLHGKSAYELWLAQGNTGTLEDFFNAYRGAQGDAGIQGQPGVQGVPGPSGNPGIIGPPGDDFQIEGVVQRPVDLPDGQPRYAVFVTVETNEFWLCEGNDQWISLGSYQGEPGAPGDVTGGILTATNLFVSPQPSRLDGWSSVNGSFELRPSLAHADRTDLVVFNGAPDKPLSVSSPQTESPAIGDGDQLWIRAQVYSNAASPDVDIQLLRRSTKEVLNSFSVVAGPTMTSVSYGVQIMTAIPANDLQIRVIRKTNAVVNEQLRVSNILVALSGEAIDYFDGSSTNDENFNYAWVSQDGYSASRKTTTTTKWVLGLDNVDNTHDLDKPISDATWAELNDVRENAGQVKSVNLMIGDVLIDKNSVGLDQVLNVAPQDLPISEQTQNALDDKADQTALDALKFVDLADISTTPPVVGDSPVFDGSLWNFRAAGAATAQDIPAGVNLDTYINAGSFVQQNTASATTALNYPIALAGLLQVQKSSNDNMIWQRYTVYGRGGAAAYTDFESTVVWNRSRYQGVWTTWKSSAVGRSFAWKGSGWLSVPNFDTFYNDATGDEVYADLSGKLRSRPQHLIYDALSNASAPNLYPIGTTIMGVSAAGGFPAAQAGLVTTVQRYGSNWTMQFFSCNATDSKLYHRFGSGTSWGDWMMVTGNTFSETNPLTAYTGFAVNSSYMNIHGHVVQLYGSIKRTGAAITASSGDIANTNMCYIRSGLPYPVSSVGIPFTGGPTLFGGVCGSDRVITLSAISPGQSLETGETITFATVYLTNTQTI